MKLTLLGYGDIVMSRPRRLPGPLEAANRVRMPGMSATAPRAILQRRIAKLHDHAGDPRPTDGLRARRRTKRCTRQKVEGPGRP